LAIFGGLRVLLAGARSGFQICDALTQFRELLSGRALVMSLHRLGEDVVATSAPAQKLEALPNCPKPVSEQSDSSPPPQ